MNSIITFRHFQDNINAMDVAFPVFAYEIEAFDPIDNQLDAYEKAVLKFIQIGFCSVQGMAKALLIQDTLVETIIQHLELKRYITPKDKQHRRSITQDGIDALKGDYVQLFSENSQFGYMFVSACRKNILPYFISGAIDKNKLVDNSETNNIIAHLITINKKETDTFLKNEIDSYLFQEQYKSFIKNSYYLKKYNEDELTYEEAKQAIQQDIPSIDNFDFSEESELFETLSDVEERKKANKCVRLLDTPPHKLYLRMRIIFDETSRTGFRVESPFDFDDIDEEYFIRQIQWLINRDDVFIGEEKIAELFNRELFKLKGNQEFTLNSSNTELYIKAKIPLLYSDKRFNEVFIQLKDCLEMHTNSEIEKKAQIMELNSCVMEALLDRFILSISIKERCRLKRSALAQIEENGEQNFFERIFNWNIVAPSDKEKMIEVIKPSINSLVNTCGKSIIQKLFNIILINYYLTNKSIRSYVSNKDFAKNIGIIIKMNNVRILTGHNVKDRKFTSGDYDYYIENLPSIINSILQAQKEN